MIQLQGVTKRYDEKEVLQDLTLVIPDGSIFGLIGPNGAGKSTLLQILAGILKADAGTVHYDGCSIYEQPEMKEQVLLLSEEPYYFLHATANDMKTFYQAWYPSFQEERYKDYLRIFGIEDNKPLASFSKGMKRLAFLAIALAIAPKYLLLDEAFDGLDPMMRLTFKRIVCDLIEEKNMTVIISSHNLRELEDICDQFGILDHQKMETSGDVYDTKNVIHKIQVAFKQPVEEDWFQGLDVLSCKIQSKVANLVIKGDLDKIQTQIEAYHPVLFEVLAVTLEEIFIYEMERKGYGDYEKES